MLLTEYIQRREFRDPSTYASFYYPQEGPDTERELSEAEEEAKSVVEEDAATVQEDLQQDYPDATVTGTVVGVTDEDVDSGSDYYHYTCKVKCELRISIPKENFANKDDNEISDELSNIYSIITSTEIDYEDEGDEEITDASAEIVLRGSYAYYYENDRD